MDCHERLTMLCTGCNQITRGGFYKCWFATHKEDGYCTVHSLYLGGKNVSRESTSDELPEDVVDGGDGGCRHVENAEVALQTVGDVVLSTPGGVHRGEVPAVDYHFHVADGLVQRVHAALFQELSYHLVGPLIAPVVHHRHGNIIHEHEHLFPARGAVCFPLALLQGCLDAKLERLWGGQARKGD